LYIGRRASRTPVPPHSLELTDLYARIYAHRLNSRRNFYTLRTSRFVILNEAADRLGATDKR